MLTKIRGKFFKAGEELIAVTGAKGSVDQTTKIITITGKGEKDLAFFRPIIDSFRVLDRRERTIAVVDEAMPPPLAQERPKRLPFSDAAELGLFGTVRVAVISARQGVAHNRVIIGTPALARVGVGFDGTDDIFARRQTCHAVLTPVISA